MTGEDVGPVRFEAHIELLHSFLTRRREIVERLQDVLNAQRKPLQYLQDRRLLSRHLDDCFFTGIAADTRALLRAELEEAHWASGFRPSQVAGLHNDLVDPVEMMIRGFHCWQQTRWPGRNGRSRYAHCLFNLYLLRRLVLLSMRIWDAGPDAAADRLAEIQRTLDGLWQSMPSDQPVLVRDAHWLIPLAQSPTTDELAAYFEVAERVAASFSRDEGLEIQKAAACVLGGHLRSQIRHYCLQDGVAINENSVVQRTRTSNALDFALLIQCLVPLLEAYDRARQAGDEPGRRELADVIWQGISPDPELFVNRVDLLGPYSMIEHLFITTDPEGRVGYTRLGQRHVALLQEYRAMIGRQTEALSEDCRHLRPTDGGYSPYGAIFGTPTNLIEDMALKTLTPDGVTGLSLEDVFTDGDASTGKLGWVNGWRDLPHVARDVRALYKYPQQFAEDMFDRVEQALRRGAAAAGVTQTPRTGRLFIVPVGDAAAASTAAEIPDLPVRYIRSSDRDVVAAEKAEFSDQIRLLHDRREGHFLLSYETSGGWVAIRKDCITEVLGAGNDMRVTGLSAAAAGVLRLMCPGLVDAPSGSA